MIMDGKDYTLRICIPFLTPTLIFLFEFETDDA